MNEVTHQGADGESAAACPRCGLEEPEAGGVCEGCGRAVVLVPEWAENSRHGRQIFTRRRVLLAIVSFFLIGLVLWWNLPLIPDPLILLFKRPSTELASESLPGQWSMDGRDLQHTRHVSAVQRQLSGQILWSQSLGEPTRSNPVVKDGLIYIGGHFKILAIEARSGRIVWERETTGPVDSSLAVAGESLYVGLLDHHLLALDIRTGKTRWEFKTQDIITASPLVADGIVYIGSSDSFVYALDASTGKVIWQRQLGGPVHSQPAIYNGNLYAGDSQGNLYVLSARTGQKKLLFRTSGSTTRSPVVANGLVYFPSEGRIYAIDADAREIPGQYQLKQVWAQLWLWQIPGVPRPPGQQGGRWRFTPERPSRGGIASSPAVAANVFYVGDTLGNFYARSALDGTELWRYQADGAIVASPVVVGDRVYFGASDGILHALDRTSGEVAWRLPLGASIEASPAFAMGRLYVRTSDGRLHAIE